MRIHAHFRIRAHLQNFVKRVRRWAVAAFVLLLLFSALVVGKNVFLGEIKKEIHKSFAFDSIRLSYFPPALTLEDVRSLSTPPLFRARRLRVEVPFLSLIRNEKDVVVDIEGLAVRLNAELLRARPGRPTFSLPFTISRGVIRDALVTFEGTDNFFEVQELRAAFTQSGDEFTVRAASDKAIFGSLLERMEIAGALNIVLAGKGGDLQVRRFTIEGPELVVKAEGSVRNLMAPEIDLTLRYEAELGFAAPLLRMPFLWQGKVTGEGTLVRKDGKIAIATGIASDKLLMNGALLGSVKGNVTVGAGGARVDVEVQKPERSAETVVMTIGKGRVDGTLAGVYADPFMSTINVPWPVKSPLWGTVAVAGDKVDADIEFRDPDMTITDDRFPLRGRAVISFDTRTEDLTIAAPDLEIGFGRLESRTALRVHGDVDASIRGSVVDLKQARSFVSLILAKTFDFPEIRGSGYTDVRLTGKADDPKVTFKGSFTPAGFDRFDVAFAEGEGVISGDVFEAKFRVEDPSLKSNIHVRTDPTTTEAEFQGSEGDLAAIFTGLEIPVSLKGRAAGDFKLVQSGKSQDVTGSFTSPEIDGYGQKALNVKGTMEWKDGTLSFPEIGFDLYGGHVRGRVLLGTVSRAFDADLKGENINLSLLTPRVEGVLAFTLAGRGVFGQDRLRGRYTVKNLFISPVQKTEAAGAVELEYVKDQVVLGANAVFSPGDNEAEGRFTIPLEGDTLEGSIKGHWMNLDLLLPWTGAKGRLDYAVTLSGPRASPEVKGTVTCKGTLLPFPRFAQAATDFAGTVEIHNEKLTVTDFQAKFGGGDVRASGDIGLGKDGVETIDVGFTGKDMQVTALERTRALVDGDGRLLKDARQFVLDGNFLVKRLLWRREVYENFSFSSEAALNPSREPGFFDTMSLNLHLRATDNAVMENSLGRVICRFDLSLTGNIYDPVLLGDIEILRGSFTFQDTTFRVVSGRVSFFNPASTEPYLEIKAETYVKNYRVALLLTGPPSRLKPEFTSSPPMPPEDVLALLALGEAFRSTYSYTPERSTTLSTASLVTFQLAEQAKKGTRGLFTLDRFRVDPFVTSSTAQTTARLTLGKKLSKNVLFIYSTNLSTVRDEIYRMEWDIGTDFSLVGLRDEFERISFDLRIRKRF